MRRLCSGEMAMCSSRKNPYPPHGRSLEIPRSRGFLKGKILERKYEAKLEFPGGTGGAKQKTFHGGSMDIFWNCTITEKRTGTEVAQHQNGEGTQTSFFMFPIPHNKTDYNVRRNNYYAPLLQRGMSIHM